MRIVGKGRRGRGRERGEQRKVIVENTKKMHDLNDYIQERKQFQ